MPAQVATHDPMLRLVLPLATALVVAGCVATPAALCRDGEEQVIADTLYFGTNKPGGVVSIDEWQDFLATGVTPRFPQGITSWRASGQWRSENGKLEHEASYVLQLVHANSADTERAVREVMTDYRKRFEQEAVLRVRLPACVSLR